MSVLEVSVLDRCLYYSDVYNRDFCIRQDVKIREMSTLEMCNSTQYIFTYKTVLIPESCIKEMRPQAIN